MNSQSIEISAHHEMALQARLFRSATEMLRIHNLLLVCLAIVMLVPPTIKIAGVTIFDLCIYTVLFGYALTTLRSGTLRFSVSFVESGLYGLILLTSITYITNLSSSDAQYALIKSLGFNSDFLYLRLSAYGLLTLILFIGVYRVCSQARISENDLQKLINVIAASGTANALVTLAAWLIETRGAFARYNYIPPIEASMGMHVDRMAFVFVVAYAAWLFKVGRPNNRWLLIMTMFSTFASIATILVRQGWVMFALGVLIVQGLAWKQLSKRVRWNTIVAMSLVLVLSSAFILTQYQGEVQSSFTGLFHDSEPTGTAARVILWTQGFSILKEHLFMGVGYGHYVLYSTASVFVNARQEVFVASAHNGLLMIAAEFGLLGLVCFGWLCMSMFQVAMRARNAAHTAVVKAVTTATVSLLIVTFLSQMVSNSTIISLPVERLSTQEACLIWMLLGYASAILREGGSLPRLHSPKNEISLLCVNQSR